MGSLCEVGVKSGAGRLGVSTGNPAISARSKPGFACGSPPAYGFRFTRRNRPERHDQGRDSVATTPPSSALSRAMRPWCSDAISRTKGRPRPVLFLRECGRASE